MRVTVSTVVTCVSAENKLVQIYQQLLVL